MERGSGGEDPRRGGQGVRTPLREENFSLHRPGALDKSGHAETCLRANAAVLRAGHLSRRTMRSPRNASDVAPNAVRAFPHASVSQPNLMRLHSRAVISRRAAAISRPHAIDLTARAVPSSARAVDLRSNAVS